MEDCQQLAEFASEVPSTSCFSKDFKALKTSWKQGFSKHLKESELSQYLSVEAYEDELLPETEGVNHLEKIDKPQSSSTSSEELMACVVEDSLEANGMYDQDENNNDKENISPASYEDPVLQSDVEQATKRVRLMQQRERRFA